MIKVCLLIVCCVSRQFYHLASVRLQDLCNRLDLFEEDLRKKIWTCFEYSVMYHTDLMQDRHLDQILMCAVYVICKVSRCRLIVIDSIVNRCNCLLAIGDGEGQKFYGHNALLPLAAARIESCLP